MRCPVCPSELRETGLEEQYCFEALDVCRDCRGIWFDKGELDRLDGSIWVNIEDHPFHEVEGDHRQVGCPRCKLPLAPVSFRQQQELIVDRCPKCEGFWLDGDELQRVVHVADGVHDDLTQQASAGKKLNAWQRIWLAVRRIGSKTPA